MDYTKTGNQLKLARERKGLSYEQIFEVTRIQPSILKEIEEGKASVAPVFLKGFIKTYARFLGLDPEELFNQAIEKEEQKDELKKETKKPGANGMIKRKSYVSYLLLSIGFLILIQIIWIGLPANIDEQNETTKNKTAILEKESEKNIQTKTREELAIKTQEENNQLQEHSSLFDQIKKSVFKEELLLRSFEPLEIYFKMDQQSTITKILKPSVWFQIKAKKSIYLRFDENRGDIQIFYNGQQIKVGSKSFFERTFSQ